MLRFHLLLMKCLNKTETAAVVVFMQAVLHQNYYVSQNEKSVLCRNICRVYSNKLALR